MSDGITLNCPRCGKYSCLKKEYDNYKGIDVYTCQEKDCGRRFAIEMVVKKMEISEGKQ
jgi:transcription elongation factor Elf1